MMIRQILGMFLGSLLVMGCNGVYLRKPLCSNLPSYSISPEVEGDYLFYGQMSFGSDTGLAPTQPVKVSVKSEGDGLVRLTVDKIPLLREFREGNKKESLRVSGLFEENSTSDLMHLCQINGSVFGHYQLDDIYQPFEWQSDSLGQTIHVSSISFNVAHLQARGVPVYRIPQLDGSRSSEDFLEIENYTTIIDNSSISSSELLKFVEPQPFMLTLRRQP